MLCPYHGSYNAKLDRCPGCVESRLRTVTTAGTSLEVQPESDELATLRARIAAAVAECERVVSESHAAHPDRSNRRERAKCAVAIQIRAKLEGR